uniref:PLAC8 family protein n=1 Tax=Cyclophora tenuis TaxID=216820 RepID=A0A7S1GQQ2_CYCTE|mmetsp:Transcript_5230/g.9046  ORF Transcript_5230/g.9046 Transcript_5230/m.9046 type:complete len:280 (+) Transcript_5230:3-842(+)
MTTVDKTSDDYVKLDKATEATDVAELVKAVKMVEVIAPADLPEGYTFEADVDGTRVPVVVPAGGVKKDQQFRVPMPDESAGPTGVTGAWKDGLFNCLSLGICHPHFCLGCWCRPLALAQVMTRMRLTWTGEPGNVSAVSKTFRNVVVLFVAFIALDNFLSVMVSTQPLEFTENVSEDGTVHEQLVMSPTASLFYALRSGLETCFFLYLLLATCRTRQAVRTHYNIPEQNCQGCEDFCCALWCSACSVCQMMRHTTDYETYPAACCTDTGLPANAPQSVV